MYAFAGDTGALRWKHEPGDFEGGSSLGHESHDLTVCVMPQRPHQLLSKLKSSQMLRTLKALLSSECAEFCS